MFKDSLRITSRPEESCFLSISGDIVTRIFLPLIKTSASFSYKSRKIPKPEGGAPSCST